MFNISFKKVNISKKGFSLVEIMVSLAIFSIVAVSAGGAFLKVVDANKKSQALKTVTNNLNYALESMSREIRTGTKFSCGQSYSPVSGACSSHEYFNFQSQNNQIIIYRYNSSNKSLEKSIDGNSFSPVTSLSAGGFSIDDMLFIVMGGVEGDSIPSKVQISIKGSAGLQEKIKSEFTLQTSVTARNRE